MSHTPILMRPDLHILMSLYIYTVRTDIPNGSYEESH